MSTSSQLTWQGNFEWEHDDIRDRTGVVTKDWGPRDRHTIRLGLDPSYNAPSRALHYWPLEEDPSSTSVIEDVISGADAYWEGNPLPADKGAVGTNAPHFSAGGEVQAVNFSDNAGFDHGGEFTFTIFFETHDDRNLRTIFHTARPFNSRGGILVSKNEGPRIGVSIHDGTQWHTRDDFHLGTMQLHEPYFMTVRLREVGGEWRVGVDLNGTMEEQVIDVERPALSADNNFGAAGSLWYADARDFGAELDEIMYWDYALTNFELREIERSYGDGYLLTRWLKGNGRAHELVVNHNSPPETDTYVTVTQDVTGNGSVDHFQTVPLEQNIGTYQLSGFQDTESLYSLEFILRSNDPYVTQEIEYGQLRLETEPPAGVWETGDDGILDADEATILTV